MQTAIRLLTSDGVITAVFRPALDPEHYTEMYGWVKGGGHGYRTRQDLRDHLAELAKQWGVAFEAIDESL